MLREVGQNYNFFDGYSKMDGIKYAVIRKNKIIQIMTYIEIKYNYSKYKQYLLNLIWIYAIVFRTIKKII